MNLTPEQLREIARRLAKLQEAKKLLESSGYTVVKD